MNARTAIVAIDGTYSHEDLDAASRRVAGALLGAADDLQQARVAFLVAPSFAYVAAQRGIWRAGGIAVPLAVSHPPTELEYVVRDAGAAIVLGPETHRETLEPIAAGAGARFLAVEDALMHPPVERLPHIGAPRRAMIVYTSGTPQRRQ